MPQARTENLRIGDVAFGGRGVGRRESDGRVVFVPFVLAGELVRVQILREHRSYLEARPLAILEPSPQRVTPRCPYFGRCGGCSYQHAADAEQRAIKERQVGEALRRVGKLEPAPGVLRPLIPSPEVYAYRNRITVHAAGDRVGYFSHPESGPGGRRELLDITHCPIAEPAVNEALAEFRGRHRRHPDPRDGHFTLRAAGRRDRRFFLQTNDGAATRLLDLVRGLLAGAPRAHLVDAYCGAGFFARALAGDFARVTGLEWDRHAVAAAREGAAAHESYLAGDVAELLAGALAAVPGNGTTVIADPPAEGLAKDVLAALRDTPPAVLVYVSCNPATLARDLARLLAGGGDGRWTLGSVTPLDMFPQTAEVECVAHLTWATDEHG